VVIGDESPAMKQNMFAKVLTVMACLLLLCASVPALTVADQARYIYDDLGRLKERERGQATFLAICGATHASAAWMRDRGKKNRARLDSNDHRG
jgi:hypothetical protein